MSARSKMIAKIQIEFPKLRPDLDPKMDADELRSARLEFCGETLGLTRPPKSLTKLNDRDLGLILDAIKEQGSVNRGPGPEPPPRESARVDGPRTVTLCNVRQLRPKTRSALEEMANAAIDATQHSEPSTQHSSEPGVIHHLAGNEQVWAIDRLFEHLNWDPDRRRKYIYARWRRTSERLLTPDQAGDLLVQLFTIAAHKELKLRLGREVKISRDQTSKEIPALKKRLGIAK